MKSAKVTDPSDYLLLHLMDGIDTGHHEPGTCFRLKLQIFTGANVENVNSSRSTLDKILPEALQRVENTEYFLWNFKTRLCLGSTTASSVLRVTLLKGSHNDDAFGREGNFEISYSKRSVYAETEISIEALRLGQYLRDGTHFNSERSINPSVDCSHQQRVEYQLALKILPEENELDEVTNLYYKTGAESTTILLKKESQPASPARAAENSYNAELVKLSEQEKKSKKESSSVQDVRCIQSPASEQDRSQRFFQIRFGYTMVLVSSATSGYSTSADVAEVTDKFFRAESTCVDSNNHALRGVVGVIGSSVPITLEPFVGKRSSCFVSKFDVANRCDDKTDKASKKVGNKASTSTSTCIYDELHSMCSASRFQTSSKVVHVSAHDDESSQIRSSQLQGRFLGKEGEIPSRTFIELLRLRVSPAWAEMVQGLVSELSECSSSGRGVAARNNVSLLGVTENDINVNGNSNAGGPVGRKVDLSRTVSSTIDLNIAKTMNMLREGAQVRVIGRDLLGAVTVKLTDGMCHVIKI